MIGGFYIVLSMGFLGLIAAPWISTGGPGYLKEHLRLRQSCSLDEMESFLWQWYCRDCGHRLRQMHGNCLQCKGGGQ